MSDKELMQKYSDNWSALLLAVYWANSAKDERICTYAGFVTKALKAMGVYPYTSKKKII